MSPTIGAEDRFEDVYLPKFDALLAPHGLAVQYVKDRAALDRGLHLYEGSRSGDTDISRIRVWFQLKGKHASTVSEAQFHGQESVSKDLSIDHLRYWYASPEAVYLVLYIESVDLFLAEDVRDIVDRQWRRDILSPTAFPPNQKTARVHVLTSAVLDDRRIAEMRGHRSMRIDGPSFRGRPLGHRLDPYRSIPEPLTPSDFDALVGRLLEYHDF
jgi:hypothetical protein